jgi:diguanylate cyclase (GGDEF)-like protein
LDGVGALSNFDLRRSLNALWLPGAALLMLFAIWLTQADTAELVGAYHWAPPRIAALVMVVAMVFGQARLTLISATLIVLWSGLHGDQSADPEVIQALRISAGILLPLNIAVFAVLPERGLFNVHGAWRAFVVAAQTILVWRLAGQDLPALIALNQTVSVLLPLGFTLAIGFAAGLLAAVLRAGPTESAFVALLIALTPELAGVVLPGVWLVASIALGAGLIQHAWELAFRDALTGLPDRRALEMRLRALGSRFSIGMVDVDHFKAFNDTHGHEVGDQVLRMVASRLRRVGAGGKTYRYGGEEFCIVFNRDDKSVRVALDVLREDIQEYGFNPRASARPPKDRKGKKKRKDSSGDTLKVTVSIGWACRSEDRSHPLAVVDAADQALYQAKKRGRNRVSFAR